jgi:hypothetical protein
MRSRLLAVFSALVVLATGVAVGLGGGNVLFHLTADLACRAERRVPGFVGCPGVPRGAWSSWVLSILVGIAVAMMLWAIARGWMRDHRAGLALAGVVTVLVFAALVGWKDNPIDVVALCVPDGQGGCLGYAVPPETWASWAATGAVTGVVLFAFAVILGRRARDRDRAVSPSSAPDQSASS